MRQGREMMENQNSDSPSQEPSLSDQYQNSPMQVNSGSETLSQ